MIPFVFAGAHSAVTGCDLPEWLPPYLVDELIDYFGRMLRYELVLPLATFVRLVTSNEPEIAPTAAWS